jgi:hypothetical protein
MWENNQPVTCCLNTSSSCGHQGFLCTGSREAHGEQHVQRQSMLDGAQALLAVPPGGDFAIQLLSRALAECAGVAILSHGSAAGHHQGGLRSPMVHEARAGDGAPRRRKDRRGMASEVAGAAL